MLLSYNYDPTGCQEQPSPDAAARGDAHRPAASDVRVKPRSGSKRAGARRGSTLIEFTLVMPILLMTMTGMVAFGLALRNELVLTNAVNGGAQLLAFSRGQTTDPCATAYSAISSAAPSLTTGLSVTYTLNGNTYSTNSCAAGATSMVQGANAVVSATYPCALGVFRGSFNCQLGATTTEIIQ